MAIIDTMQDNTRLYHDLQKTDGYKNNFSYEGAIALFDYLDQLSDDIGENIEYDPICWCVEYSEYKDFEEFQNDKSYIKDGKQVNGYEDINNLDELRDNTEVIEFDSGIIVRDF